MNKKITQIWFIVLMLAGSNASLQSQVTQEDVEQAENRAKIARAKKEEYEARFPKPDASTLVGDTEVKEGEFIESRILGYCAMKRAAKNIAEIIHPTCSNCARRFPPDTNLVVYDEDSVAKMARYALIMRRLGTIENGFRQVKVDYLTILRRSGFGSRAVLPSQSNQRNALAGAGKRSLAFGPIIATALNYLSLLKTDVTIDPQEFDIGEKELVAEVFRWLPKGSTTGFNLFYPKIIPLTVDPTGQSPLQDGVFRTADEHDSANYLKDVVDPAKLLNQELATIVAGNRRTQIENDLPEVEEVTRRLETLNQLFDLTMRELGFAVPEKKCPESKPCPEVCADKGCKQTTSVTVNVGQNGEEASKGAGGGATFLSYLQIEKYYTEVNRTGGFWVDLKVIKAGGNLRTKKNFITNFALGSRINFSGGVLVYFNVFDKTGKSAVSGVIPAYEKYRKSSRINATCE